MIYGMNQLPFREHHLFTLLQEYSLQTLPLDLFISHYFRNHSALGSKDRGFIAETVYQLIRWQALLEYLNPNGTWPERYDTLLNWNLSKLQKRNDIPLATRASFPPELFRLMTQSWGIEKAYELCMESNKPAPTTIRVNTLKTTREALFEKWKGLYDISLTSASPDGIIFHKKIHFFQLAEFKEGLFEVQDEGSQLLAHLVRALPGQQVLDYCSGSGGKTLAFAPLLQGKGQIFLHDIRPFALQEAKKRLRRAGIQNSQIISAESPHLLKLKKKMDWVLVDAPCSGTGTLRRNPDMKWKFTLEMLKRLVGQQRTIFEKALSFLHPEGRIVYATCSILKEENKEQLDHFLNAYKLVVETPIFQSLPSAGSMDGFFGVVLKRA